jgi:hypothetical protein
VEATKAIRSATCNSDSFQPIKKKIRKSTKPVEKKHIVAEIFIPWPFPYRTTNSHEALSIPISRKHQPFISELKRVTSNLVHKEN